MFRCMDCGLISPQFNLGIAGISEGAFMYMVECPACGSRKAANLPGHFERDLRISIESQDELGETLAPDGYPDQTTISLN